MTFLVDTAGVRYGVIHSLKALETVLRHVAQCTGLKMFDSETDGLAHDRKAIGFSISVMASEAHPELGYSWYVPVRHKGDQRFPNVSPPFAFRLLFQYVLSRPGALWAHNWKFDLHVLRNEGVEVEAILTDLYDSMIVAWLLNPEARKGLKGLVKDALGYEMTEFAFFKEYGENALAPIIEMAPYAVDDVRWLGKLLEAKLLPDLANRGEATIKVFEEMETPLLRIVEDMENEGFLLDVDYLHAMDRRLKAIIWDLEKAIAEVLALPVEALRLTSTQWLSRLLIDELGWWGVRTGWVRGKSGLYSTAAAILKEWADGQIKGTTKAGQRVAKLLLRHRGASKLRSTYTVSLVAQTDERGYLHGSLNQVGTATGRFSSSGPNLQNIPVPDTNPDPAARLPNIRQAFIAEPGSVILGADYSQIELRVLAHLSQDASLLQIYQEGGDVHQMTADACGVPRQGAKSINFGIIYGMGPGSLAYTLGVSLSKARQYLESYYDHYSSVKPFQARTKAFARKNGFVTTLVGRRRFLPDINNPDYVKRGYDERKAVNTKIQGSAADLIKIAMRNIQSSFIAKGWVKEGIARMILQVHDELLFRVKEEYVEEVAAEVSLLMETAVKLRVPLIAEPHWGRSWADAK